MYLDLQRGSHFRRFGINFKTLVILNTQIFVNVGCWKCQIRGFGSFFLACHFFDMKVSDSVWDFFVSFFYWRGSEGKKENSDCEVGFFIPEESNSTDTCQQSRYFKVAICVCVTTTLSTLFLTARENCRS